MLDIDLHKIGVVHVAAAVAAVAHTWARQCCDLLMLARILDTLALVPASHHWSCMHQLRSCWVDKA
jgi:hypothetical protein